MSDFMHGLKTSGIVWLLTGSGILVSALTADALLPLFPLAAGFAVAIVYLRRAPIEADIRAQVLVMDAQIRRVADMLDDETASHDRTREKLRIAKDALIDAGIRIKHLENESEDHGSIRKNP